MDKVTERRGIGSPERRQLGNWDEVPQVWIERGKKNGER